MARRDYKYRASRKGKKPVAIWVWLLIGYLAGAGSIAFLCLQYGTGASTAEWIGETPVSSAAKPAPEQQQRSVQEPSFDFYNLLPDQEVVVPEEELSRSEPRPPAEPSRAPGSAQAKRRYMLQVSSMRSAREADALKAKLAFLGMQAQVSRAQIKGVTWYRVRLGPYPTTTAMQQARKRLAASGYQSLPIALK